MSIHSAVKSAIKNSLARAFSNSPAQRTLQRFVTAAQWLMGIGAGSTASSSGERSVLTALRQQSMSRRIPICVFDVGANRGQFLSLVLRELDGLDFQVHVFEPSASAFRVLSADHSQRATVILNNCGLGNKPGSLTLYSDEEGSPLASVYPRRLEHFGLALTACETVTIDSVDAYCKHRNISYIDLLKIDVEGHELEVLRGAASMFRLGNIGMVTFEFGGTSIDSRVYMQDFFYFFAQYGFNLLRITPTGYLSPLPKYKEEYEQFRTTNFLARRGRGTECKQGERS